MWSVLTIVYPGGGIGACGVPEGRATDVVSVVESLGGFVNVARGGPRDFFSAQALACELIDTYSDAADLEIWPQIQAAAANKTISGEDCGS